MTSSYDENNYGEVFEAIVDAFEPAVTVELGVLTGYSTRHIARGILQNKHGIFDAYDLFEDYPYKHSQYQDIKNMFNALDYGFVNLHKQDAFTVHEKYPDNTVSLLHVDLSNTGETVQRIMALWDKKMVYGGIILFEGGSEERDGVEWMIKYNKPSIKKELETNQLIKDKYVFGTYLKFPSLTFLLKRRE